MKVEVLVAAMNQDDHSLVQRMNLQTDAIIGNQCGKNQIEDFLYKNNKIRYLSFNERGVGLNRNNALMRATGDICIFADDDMRFFDGYEKTVVQAFCENPKADVIVFNIKEKEKIRHINRKNHRVNKFNFLRYGAARIAIKLDSIKKQGIYFNLCFGGGTEHSAGEDNLFLASCLKHKLKIYASKYYLAELLDCRESSWFKGYNKKYIQDKGLLFRIISPSFWFFLCLQDCIRHHKRYKMSFFKTLLLMIKKA